MSINLIKYIKVFKYITITHEQLLLILYFFLTHSLGFHLFVHKFIILFMLTCVLACLNACKHPLTPLTH